MRAVLLVSVLAAMAVPGCGAEPLESIDSTEQDVRLDPCATVRCAPGTHCVAKGHRAFCVLDEQSCKHDSDCRLFDNYCDGCACEALSVMSPDPSCNGTIVACFERPCAGRVAACKGKECVVTE